MANRLIKEESPYLQQHAQNPVEWYPWGEEAFQRAAKEKKAIFLSIGYSSCHWCHVMERESFENLEIAKKLNENFISIKVDKEERPDIDKHFQEVYQKMNNKAGGWPLSIFMTANKVPFYSATYIPPIANYGMMGFGELLDTIAKSYKQDPQMFEQKGLEVLNALKPKSKIEATKIDKQLIDIVTKQIKYVYEKEYGGFGTAPKFPHASTIELAINLYKLKRDQEIFEIIKYTLDSMLLGGLYDHVDGGFCRYSTDKMWLVPHFEKMSYDNALMAKVLLKAYRLTKEDHYRSAAFETIDFMLEKMSQDNLFFSASDADTYGMEGAYFLYDYNEVKEAFKKEGIDNKLLFELGITRNGNFDNKSIVRLHESKFKEIPEIKKALKILKKLRENREYPFIDRKVITSWNSMMIITLFEASKEKKSYLEIAYKSLKALEDKMLQGNELFHSALIENKPKIKGFLEDYAWLIAAYLSAYSATLDESYIIKATTMTNEAIKKYYRDGKWLLSNGEFKNFEEDYDTTYTSSLSLMVENLLTLRSLNEPIYEKFAFQTLQVHSYQLMRQPISRPTLADAAIRYLQDDIIIKSSEENLQPLINEEFEYPYILLKVTKDDKYEICNSHSCFASEKSLEDLKAKLNQIAN